MPHLRDEKAKLGHYRPSGSDSVWPSMERPSARPKNGRPLQCLLSTIHYGFVEAVPSHVLRDGTGTFQIESLPSFIIFFLSRTHQKSVLQIARDSTCWRKSERNSARGRGPRSPLLW